MFALQEIWVGEKVVSEAGYIVVPIIGRYGGWCEMNLRRSFGTVRSTPDI